MVRILIAALVMMPGAGCNQGISSPSFPSDADATILFIGNSLTSGHDVPRLVRMIGEERGMRISTISVTRGNFSLEDHWYNGIAEEIRRLEANHVVMQQGPSSLPESQIHLLQWTRELADVVRESGGTPALYMVWPEASRRSAFEAVETSYSAAARGSGSMLLPAGTTWIEAWTVDDDLPLYGPDGFHPSYVGALAAAYTLYAGLFDIDPMDLPALDDGVSDGHRAVLRAAVARSLQRWAD